MINEHNSASILNDVIGPVLSGPSSSHTAGPNRIARTVRTLLGEEVTEATIRLEITGSYPLTYMSHGSARGFIGGLMDMPSDDIHLINALQIAENKGMEFQFFIEDIGDVHPNAALLEVTGASGNKISAMSHSIGGGMFEIVSIDGVPVDIHGYTDGYLVKIPAEQAALPAEVLSGLEALNCIINTHKGTENVIFEIITTAKHIDKPGQLEKIHDILFSIKTAVWIGKLQSILPVTALSYEVPFTNAKEALAYSEEHNIPLADIGLVYETMRSNMPAEEVLELIGICVQAMRRSAVESVAGHTVSSVFPYSGPKMDKAIKTREYASMGTLDRAVLWSIAAEENSVTGGIVCAAPTAGSAGVCPGAIVSVGDELGKSEEEIARAMLNAGLIGVFIVNQTPFGGETGGCQAEVGAASGMSASGVVSLLGGTIKEAFDAAALALQNLLGLVCDPPTNSGGLGRPCINRNAVGVANAVASADLALWGFDPVIPLDEVIWAMDDVSKRMPGELRCTCKGALSITPTSMSEYKDS